MTPMEFDEMTGTAAKDQPEYENLPMFRDDNEVVSCWKMTWRERFKALFTGKVWLHLQVGSRPITPSYLQVDYPFVATEDTP